MHYCATKVFVASVYNLRKALNLATLKIKLKIQSKLKDVTVQVWIRLSLVAFTKSLPH